MANYNKVILMGNLTRDPELRHLPSGMAVVAIGLAVNERYKDKQSGAWVERPNFFDCEGFGRTAENINQFFSRGKPILIEGKLRMDQWEDKQSGQKRSKVKIVIDRFEFVGGRESGGGGGGDYGGRSASASSSSGPSYDGPEHHPIDEDDIPF